MPMTGGAALWPIETSLTVWLVLLLLKGMVILMLAEAVIRLARRSSASVRHLIRTVSLVALVLLPLVIALGPRWEVGLLADTAQPREVLTSKSSNIATSERAVGGQPPVSFTAAQPGPLLSLTETARPSPSPASTAPSHPLWMQLRQMLRANWPWLLGGVWAAGVILLVLRLLLSFVCIQRAINRAQPVDEGLWLDLAASAASSVGLDRPVRLVIGRDIEVALSVGLWRAVILLPQVATTWSVPRRRSILLHELAHVKRRDNLSNLAGQLACVLHWPNPLVWMASRGLIVEREQACDDEVLATGARPSEYAGHLLEIARAVAKRRFWGRLEISQSSVLKDRFKALLDPALVRYLPGTSAKFLAVTVSLALVLPLSALQPWKSAAPDAPPGASTTPSPGAHFVVPERDGSGGNGGSRPDTPRRAAFLNSDSRPQIGSNLLGDTATNLRNQPRSSAPRESMPTDREIAARRAWPMTQVITSGGHLSPTAVRLWAEGPPHLIWGANSNGSEATPIRTPGARPRTNLPVARIVSSSPAPPAGDSPGATIQPPPSRDVKLRVEVQRHELGTLGGAESLATDINEAGMVVGRSKVKTGLDHPFLWTETSGMVDLGANLQVHSRALQINETGRVLFETFNSLVFSGFVWTLETGAVDLGALSLKQPFTLPSSLNEATHVVGGSRDDGGILRAFLWTPQEGMLDLGAPEWSEALAVNESDQVVGYSGAQAFIWDRVGGLRFVGPGDSLLSIATDINNHGQVVGYADFGGDYPQAFIWEPDTGARPLGTVSAEFPISFALSIDEHGQVLGRSVTAPREGLPEQIRIFRWSAERGLEDLGPIADENQLAVNALGQIVAAYSDGSEATERSLAVIWTAQGPVTVDLDEGSGGHTESQVAAVNNRGQLVGSSLGPDRERRAMLWDIRVVRE